MHYSASDTSPSLQKYDTTNIQEITSTFNQEKKPEIGYVLLIDLEEDWDNPPSSSGTRLSGRSSHLLQLFDQKLELITSSPLDMGSPETLKDFLDIANNIIPADNTILIITDHGKGLFGIAQDAHPENIMEIIELDSALSNNRVDLLILEACSMAQIEVLYELRDKADYIISSEIQMPGTGFSYSQALSPLLSNPSHSALSIGEIFVSTFNSNDRFTVSLIDTSRLEFIVQALDPLADALNQMLTENKEGLFTALQDVISFTPREVKTSAMDIKVFVENLKISEVIDDPELDIAVENVINAVEAAVLENNVNASSFRMVRARGFVPDPMIVEKAFIQSVSWRSTDRAKVKLRDFSGITVGFSQSALHSDFLQKYLATEFSKNTDWLSFQKNYNEFYANPNSKTVIKKNQFGNNLYLRILDPDGNVIGFDPQSQSRSKLESHYQDAEYYRFINGTEIIELPFDLLDFTTVIYGGEMEDNQESYSLTYTRIENNEMISKETVENPNPSLN
jgi:hypothetical protein